TRTLSKEAAGWYLARSCAEVPMQPLLPPGQETGIDRGRGLESCATLADGTRVVTPRHSRKAARARQHAQRRVSRRKKSSRRRRKAARLLAKKPQQVRRQRQDFHHTAALALVRQDDTI